MSQTTPPDERKILLIEDETKIAIAISEGLKEHGYHVEVAYDGNIGWRLFEIHSFNLIILDINLPQINGYELCRMIRSRNAEIPIIMLTALNSLSDKVEGYDSGADDYIVKPFEFTEVLMKIRVLLKRTMNQNIPSGNILRAGDLEINLDTKEARREEVNIHLTAKEFQLLEYLMRNKNRLVSRADIAVNVWNIDFDTNTNVIEVYINYIRNKVDKPFDTKLIHTHVGMGYILKDN